MIFNCPSNIITGVSPGKDQASVDWIEPYAINLSTETKITRTHKPKEWFSIGTTVVVYIFEESEKYKQFCNFTVTVTSEGR